MSTELDLQVEHLRSLTATITSLRELLANVEARRDVVMRQMRRDGYPAIRLAQEADVSRARAYQIFEGLGPDADDWDYQSLAERLDLAWDSALHEWIERGEQGSPDDFFPLESLLAKA